MRNDTEELKQKQDGPVVIAGKVRREVGEQIFLLCKQRGLNINEFIGMICEVLIRYMSSDHNMTSEMERAMSLFEHMTGWKDAVRMSDPKAELNIDTALYFLACDGKKGTVASLIEKPFMGIWKQTENVNHIFERTMELLMPERYRRMRLIAADMECNSQIELLDIMIDEYTKEQQFAEFRKDFEDNKRSEFGINPADAPFKRRLNRSEQTLFGEEI